MSIDIKFEGGKEISSALVEIFSPVTNLLGTLGDRVRIYRQLSLLRSLKRAQEIAKEEGLQLSEPPLKFLVPYMEECSLESPEDLELIELWAKLLTSASSTFKAEHNLFIRLPREMTSSEAQLLEYIASQESHTHYRQSWHLDDVEGQWYDPYVYIGLEKAIKAEPKPLSDATDFYSLERRIREEMEQPGSIIYYFSIGKGKKGVYPQEDIHSCMRSAIDDAFTPVSIAMLKSLGLISEYVSSEIWFGKYVFDVRTYYLTTLGSHFVRSCTRLATSSSPPNI